VRKPKRVDLKLAKHVLCVLDSKGPLRRTALEEGFPGSRAVFDGVFSFLRAEGYIVKASAYHRAPYRITEKGKRFLGGLP
jgi:predicted transcriptional regulator